jgi:hypothetical protein
MADYKAGKWARANVAAFSLLGACATEVQETNEPVTTDNEGDGAGMAGSAGSLSQAGKSSGGSGGGGAAQGGSSAGDGGGSNKAGGGAGALGGGGAGGAGGSGGKAGSGGGGAGGKPSGGAAGMSGSGGMAGMGGAPANPCATGALTIEDGAASSAELASLAAEFAYDGDTNTRWASDKSEPHWIYVDLGEVAHVSRVRLTWEAAYATSYRIERSNVTNGTWTVMQSITNGNGGTDDLTALTAGNGRYIRMFGVTRATVYGFSLYEIEVFGDLDETCK